MVNANLQWYMVSALSKDNFFKVPLLWKSSY